SEPVTAQDVQDMISTFLGDKGKSEAPPPPAEQMRTVMGDEPTPAGPSAEQMRTVMGDEPTPSRSSGEEMVRTMMGDRQPDTPGGDFKTEAIQLPGSGPQEPYVSPDMEGKTIPPSGVVRRGVVDHLDRPPKLDETFEEIPSPDLPDYLKQTMQPA